MTKEINNNERKKKTSTNVVLELDVLGFSRNSYNLMKAFFDGFPNIYLVKDFQKRIEQLKKFRGETIPELEETNWVKYQYIALVEMPETTLNVQPLTVHFKDAKNGETINQTVQ